MDIVLLSVDRSNPDVVIINTSVDLMHCRITADKAALKRLGYYVYRTQLLKTLARAIVERQIARHGGTLPLGGIRLTEDDIEGLPPNPD